MNDQPTVPDDAELDEDALTGPPDGQGVEREEYDDAATAEPFEPSKIRIETRSMTVDLLARRIKEHEIDMQPDFQRAGGLWKPVAKSRLIESLLIKIPIPAFYMDATNDEKWLVVDGLQRLTVLEEFINLRTLKLTSLEFLRDLNGKTFDGIGRPLQRRIEETQVTVYLIQPGTPPNVKFNLFKRINTGGLPLSAQEIRHAINPGPATTLLKLLAESEDFKLATDESFQNQRMTDRECVLRFFTFVLTPPASYQRGDFDLFLHEHMRRLNELPADERERLKARFLRAMRAAYAIFGKDAFRKRYKGTDTRKPINKALFEAWSVGLDSLSDAELARVVARKESLREGFLRLIRRRTFDTAISQGTDDVAKVKLRFGEIEKLLRGVAQ